MRKVLLFLCGVGIIAAACVLLYPRYQDWAYQENAKKAVIAKLVDPASAQFSDFTERKTVPDVYGSSIMRVNVNAKNSFGGYTGAKEWVVIFDSSGKVTNVGSKEELHRRFIDEVEKNMKPDKVIFAVFAAENLALMGYPHYLKRANELMDKTAK